MTIFTIVAKNDQRPPASKTLPVTGPLPAVIAALPRKTLIGIPRPTIYGGSGGMKHVTPSHCPDNGRMYFFGGDHSGDSYRHEIGSVDALQWLAGYQQNVNAGWALEQPYNGFGPGTIAPKGPDFGGWPWDEIRKKYWYVPGEEQMHNSGTVAPGETVPYASDPQWIVGDVMQYDPFAPTSAPGRFTQVNSGKGFRPAETWMSVRDPLLDKLYRLSFDGAHAWIDVFDCTTKLWESSTWCADDMVLDKEYLWADLKRRKIYGIAAAGAKPGLWSISMDVPRVGTYHGEIPNPHHIINRSYPVFDYYNDRLVHYNPYDQTIYSWNPDADTWENVPFTTLPAGRTPPHRVAAVWPDYGLLMFMGGVDGQDGVDPYIELFRL